MIKCWICGSSDCKYLWGSDEKDKLKSSDFAITNDKYGRTLPLYRCNNCSFVFAHPLPDDIVSLYENLEDDDYVTSLEPRLREMKYVLDIALPFKKDAKSILDVGAGAGLLIKAAKEKGIAGEGVEPSKWLVQKAKELFNINIIEGVLPHEYFENKKYDIVFAVDVIEHLDNPIEFLGLLKKYLNKDGVILVATPDVESFFAKQLKQKWWHFRMAHIGYFNRKSMNIAAEKAGLDIIKFKRQRWYLPFGYLLERLNKYLPIGFVVKPIKKMPKINDLPIMVNLFDNIVVVMKDNG